MPITETIEPTTDPIPARVTIWIVQNEYGSMVAYHSRAKAESRARRLNRLYNLATYEVREVALY